MPNSNPLLIVLVRIVAKYLETHKRLVIPQLGAFIVKEPGQVLFSELLKREDGVLRGLLKAEGMNELEAAGEIDRFIFEIRHTIERGVGCPLHGLGLMKPGPNSTIVFEYNPQQEDPMLRERRSPRKSTPVQSVAVREDEDAEQPAVERSSEEQPVAKQPAAERLPEEQPVAEQPAATASLRVPLESDVKVLAEQGLSGTAKFNPEPYVKGLRYGKPHKNTNAYTYVGHTARRGGVDRFLLLAIVAAAIAVAVIAFGYFRKSRDEERELRQTEQVESGQIGSNPTEQPNLQ